MVGLCLQQTPGRYFTTDARCKHFARPLLLPEVSGGTVAYVLDPLTLPMPSLAEDPSPAILRRCAVCSSNSYHNPVVRL